MACDHVMPTNIRPNPLNTLTTHVNESPETGSVNDMELMRLYTMQYIHGLCYKNVFEVRTRQ